jgi:hypothetical protein
VSDRRNNGIFTFDEMKIDCKGTIVEFPKQTLGPFTLAVRYVPV